MAGQELSPKPAGLVIGQVRARGSYGTVHSGELDGSPVVVKKLHHVLLQAPGNDKLMSDFYKECRILSTIRHANVVRFVGAHWDQEAKEPLLVMEAAKENLREFLERNKAHLGVEKQLAICYSMAEGLRFLHERAEPIIHRDLKPENVLVCEDGTVKIGDFGQSKLLDQPQSYMKTTQPGTVIYMPPEVLKKKPSYTSKVDVFSLGAVMLEVCTQSPPSVWLEGIGVVPEVERRKDDFGLLGDTHPLKPLITWCLQDSHESRPDVISTHEQVKLLVGRVKEAGYEKRIRQLERALRRSREREVGVKKRLEEAELELGRTKAEVTDLQGSSGKRLQDLWDSRWKEVRLERAQAELAQLKQTLEAYVSVIRLSVANLVMDGNNGVVQAFLANWTDDIRQKPQRADIKGVFRINNPTLKSRFDRYCASLSSPNVSWHYHGTYIKCNLIQSRTFCSDTNCGICGVSMVGFDKAKIGIHPKSVCHYGKAFYLSPNPSEGHSYTVGFSDMRALLYCQVALGTPYCIATHTGCESPPPGYNSVLVHDHYKGLPDQVAIYGVSEAILPRYIIVYQKDGVKSLR